MKKLCLTATLFFLGIHTIATAKNTPYADPKKPIFVSAANPSFSLRLQSNPGGTGYRWYLREIDTSVISLKNTQHSFQANAEGKMGGGGYEIWQFTLNKEARPLPLMTQITLVYARGWEKVSEKTTRVVLSIVNNDDKKSP